MRSFITLLLMTACAPDYSDGNIEFTTSQGVEVAPNGFPVTQEQCEVEIQRVVALYKAAFATEGWDCDPAAALTHTRLYWKTYPFTDPLYYDGRYELGGLTITWDGEYWVKVGYRDPLESTALAHELGHVFLYNCRPGHGTEPELYAFTTKHGLPY